MIVTAVEAVGEAGKLRAQSRAVPLDQDQPQLETLLRKYHAARFAVGHTVQPTFRITAHFNGRIVLMDTGMLLSF
jgi:hypothetical protein